MKQLWKTVNRILTLLAIAILAVWCWKAFGPGGRQFRANMPFVGFGLRQLFFIGVAACCVGYLVWRALTYYFETKYDLHDEDDE